MSEATHAYSAKCHECGRAVWVAVDTVAHGAEYRKTLADETIEFIRLGFIVERVTIPEARKLDFGHKPTCSLRM